MKKILHPFEWKVRTIGILFGMLLVLVFTASVWLIFSTENEVIWVQTTRIGSSKQQMAKAGAQAIESFFERAATDLKILTQTQTLIGSESDKVEVLMQEVVDRYQGTSLVSLVLTDDEGQVMISVNREGIPVGVVDTSDRDYFLWAKEQNDSGSTYLSQPLVARAGPLAGEKIVLIAAPVIGDGDFEGVAFVSIGLQKLVEDYVLGAGVYQGLDYILFNDEEEVISGLRERDLSGRTARQIVSSQDRSLQEIYSRYVDEAFSGVNSWAEVKLRLPGEERAQRWIMGFAPVDFAGEKWVIFSLVSHQEALGRIELYKKYSHLGLYLAAVFTVAIGGLSILMARKVQVEWYKKGFDACRRARKKKAES